MNHNTLIKGALLALACTAVSFPAALAQKLITAMAEPIIDVRNFIWRLPRVVVRLASAMPGCGAPTPASG